MRTLLLILCAAALAAPGVASARPAPVTWCGGADERQADRVPELELASTQQVRLVYVTPADGPDNFAAYVSGMATDAAWIDEWWEAQDPSRTPRFDRYAFPGCTSRFGALDIGFVKLRNGGAFYSSADPFYSLSNELATSFPDSEKTIVYYDGPIPDGNVCGQSPKNAGFGGSYGIAFVYLHSNCGLLPPGAGTSAQVAAHELIHNLGALPNGAPNACPGDSGHPCDSESDVLYPYVGDASTLDAVTLDVNRDDYYAHSGSWWDVQDSPWLSHLPQFPVAFSVAGSGSLAVRTPTGSLPCDNGCSDIGVDSDEQVIAVAVPSPGWRVARWSGACTAISLSCTVTVSAPVTAAVTFERAPVRAVVRITGRGHVTQTRGTGRVRLNAVPARGWRFAGWSGACSGRGGCVLTQSGTVRARFVKR